MQPRPSYRTRFLVALGLLVALPAFVARAQEALPPMPPNSILTADASAQDAAAQALVGQDEPQQADPPSVVGRISVMQGNVSLEPASVNDFSPAELNYPMTTGDRLWTDAGAQAEIQTDQLAVRMGAQTDFTVTGLTDQLMQFGLAQGSVHLRSFSFDPNVTVELDTPNAALTMLASGDARVDVYPDTDTTVFTLVSGRAEVDANGFQQMLQPGESLQLAGANPVAAHDVQRAAADALDAFSGQLDDSFQQAEVSEGSYVNAGTIGADDLSGAGDWDSSTSDFGVVWYPRVAIGWQPYRFGHWCWIAPWGWTWVEREPWGFAPFHYGRWVRNGERWGWVPGPRIVRPVYAPALVVFAGGANFVVGGTTGVTAWFPLGPREPFAPWYHTSTVYRNRVNVSNIFSRNTMEVHRVYNERGEEVYGDQTGAGRVYANRAIATVAVPQSAFAAGRPVQQAALKVTPSQLTEAPLLAHPDITPVHSIVAPKAAQALPPQAKRPVLETRAEQPREEVAAPGVQAGPVYRAPAAKTAPVATHGAPAAEPSTAREEAAPGATHEAATPQPEERPLVNRVVPPAPRPSFVEQQKAMENTEPGRPLSPVQMNAVRSNQPVPRQPPPASHPPAPAKSAPAPASHDDHKH